MCVCVCVCVCDSSNAPLYKALGHRLTAVPLISSYFDRGLVLDGAVCSRPARLLPWHRSRSAVPHLRRCALLSLLLNIIRQ